jgi:hypothetical protein
MNKFLILQLFTFINLHFGKDIIVLYIDYNYMIVIIKARKINFIKLM